MISFFLAADLNENNASATEEISKISQLLSQQNDELATLNEEVVFLFIFAIYRFLVLFEII